MMQLVRTAGAFFWHDVREDLARPERMLSRVAAAGTALLVLAFAARAYGDVPGAVWSPAGLFAWLATGWALLGMLWVTLASFRVRVVRYRRTGLLEACAMTRTPLWKILLVIPGWDVVMTGVGALAIVALAAWTSDAAVSAAGVAWAFAHALAALVPMTAMGIVATGALLTWRFGSVAERAVRLVSTVACGALVPREVLPEALRGLGAWLPLGAMLDGVRQGLFGASDEAAVSPGVRIAVLAAVLVPLAIWSARAAIARALRGGYLAPHPDARIMRG